MFDSIKKIFKKEKTESEKSLSVEDAVGLMLLEDRQHVAPAFLLRLVARVEPAMEHLSVVCHQFRELLLGDAVVGFLFRRSLALAPLDVVSPHLLVDIAMGTEENTRQNPRFAA